MAKFPARRLDHTHNNIPVIIRPVISRQWKFPLWYYPRDFVLGLQECINVWKCQIWKVFKILLWWIIYRAVARLLFVGANGGNVKIFNKTLQQNINLEKFYCKFFSFTLINIIIILKVFAWLKSSCFLIFSSFY